MRKIFYAYTCTNPNNVEHIYVAQIINNKFLHQILLKDLAFLNRFLKPNCCWIYREFSHTKKSDFRSKLFLLKKFHELFAINMYLNLEIFYFI